MALIICPECNKEVSDRAKACPHCGFPLNEIQADPILEISEAVSAAVQNVVEPQTAPKKKHTGIIIGIISAVTLSIALLISVLLWVNRWKPVTASKEVKPYAEEAIEIIEQYLHFDIDEKTADEKIANLQQRIDRLEIDAEESQYNDADKVIAQAIDLLEIVSIKYKKDIELKQTVDILSVQIGKKPSGEMYDPKEFTYSDLESAADLFNMKNFSAVNCSVKAGSDDTALIYVNFDAMYGTKATEVQTCTKEIIRTLEASGVHSGSLYITYEYYEQSIFTIMLTYSNEYGIGGRIFKSNYDDAIADIENEDQLDRALRKAASYAKIK